jgi:uncharacterized protein YkwD
MEITSAAPRPRLGRLLLVLAVMVVTLTACFPPTPEEQSLIDRTNQARTQAGLAPLAQHDALVWSARFLAMDLAQRGVLEHSDLHALPVTWQAAGENIGRGSEMGQIIDALASSPPHRRNMTSSSYTYQGVGTAQGADGRIYVVQLFCRC